jgi:hypothetical protein
MECLGSEEKGCEFKLVPQRQKNVTPLKDNKYYTPDLEEFHIGFEYELETSHVAGVLEDKGYRHHRRMYPNTSFEDYLEVLKTGMWIKTSFTERDDLVITRIELGNKYIKTKYLDKDDIEELGWKSVPTDLENYKIVNTLTFIKDDYTLILYDKEILKEGGWNIPNMNIFIEDKNTKWKLFVFYGDIKNKSVLKQVMKMLNIKS